VTRGLRVLVTSDTHIPDFAKALPATLIEEAKRSDVVLHAGDVTSPAVLEELATHAPLHVAIGNNDGPEVSRWGGRLEVHLDLEGCRIAMLHDSGPTRAREGRMRRRFPEADLVVFGHSHIPIDVEVDGQRLFNPGSPTWKRRQPEPTYGILEIHGGKLRSRIVPVPVIPLRNRKATVTRLAGPRDRGPAS
jgi:putative phosphoesterase